MIKLIKKSGGIVAIPFKITESIGVYMIADTKVDAGDNDRKRKRRNELHEKTQNRQKSRSVTQKKQVQDVFLTEENLQKDRNDDDGVSYPVGGLVVICTSHNQHRHSTVGQ